jgi:hypothetical protein
MDDTLVLTVREIREAALRRSYPEQVIVDAVLADALAARDDD